MQISGEGKIGITLGLLGLGASGALFVLQRPYADYLGWTLIGLLVLGLILLVRHHFKNPTGGWQRRGARQMWPQYLMAFSGCLFLVGLVAFLQLNVAPPTKDLSAEVAQPKLEVIFESRPPYETNEITNGRVLSTVRIGLKVSGKPLSNCRVFVEKIAPEPPIAGGLPILLEGGGFILRTDDPEKLFDLASHWNHVSKFRFSSPIGGAFFAESLSYVDDNVERVVEIKIDATELQKTFLFKIWTDESKKLHLKPL